MRLITAWRMNSLHGCGRIIEVILSVDGFPWQSVDSPSIIFGKKIIVYSRCTCISVFKLLIDCNTSIVHVSCPSDENRWKKLCHPNNILIIENFHCLQGFFTPETVTVTWEETWVFSISVRLSVGWRNTLPVLAVILTTWRCSETARERLPSAFTCCHRGHVVYSSER